MNCFLGVPAIAVGLSAISLLAKLPSRTQDFGTSTSSVTSSPSPKLVPETLAKDAAPIPNATCKKRVSPFPRATP